jgi:hypothetical protein
LPDNSQKDIVLRFLWTGKMWGLIPKIDALINQSNVSRDWVMRHVFSSVFWKKHHFNGSKPYNIAIHIRCGDSTKIKLGNKDLIVYDKYLFSSENEMTEILRIDPDRISVSPEEYLPVYQKLINTIPSKDYQISVISDGYELTYQHILRNLLKRKTQIKLSKSDLNVLKQKIEEKNTIFSQFSSAELIIGEKEPELYRSLLQIAGANLVIWGCGGFATNTHQLLKSENNASKIMKLSQFSVEEILAK